jgi:negative regulator of genetic competence, sporulation and motility
MEIQAGINGKISVTLTKKDLQDLDITYDELDYSNIETRRVIWTILDKARLALGKSITLDNRLLINAIPINDGGCCLEFTQLPFETETTKAKTVLKKGDEPILFCSFDLDAYLDCIKHIPFNSQGVKSISSYIFQNNYYVIIYPEAEHSKNLLFKLCEFGEIKFPSQREIADICEGGKKLS